ncbi:MAG: DUF2846 domain-containing protein [Candidatus Sulfotelmatobacter sp.]
MSPSRLRILIVLLAIELFPAAAPLTLVHAQDASAPAPKPDAQNAPTSAASPTPVAAQAAAPAQGPEATSPAPQILAPAWLAHLHVYRQPQFVGGALFPSIYVDGRQVARVGNGRRVTIKLTPGSHYIKSDDKGSAITLDAKAGQDYYLRVDEVQGVIKGKGKVTLVPPEQGAPEYMLQRPIEESRVVAPEMVEIGGGHPALVPSAQLEADITGMIQTLEGAEHPGCELQILKQVHSLSDRIPIVERWDVKSCDATSSYDVQIVPSPKGGSDFRVAKSKSVQTQEKITDTPAPPPQGSETAPSAALSQEPRPEVKTGEIKGGKQYTSGKGMFSITVPPRNWAVDTYKFREAQLKNGNYDFEEVVFYIPDFGQAYGAGVRRIPQAALAQMAKEEEKQTLSNLANKALFQWREGYAEEPQSVEENSVQTQFGGGLVRIYLAKRSSIIEIAAGGGKVGDLKGERVDTHIAVLVVKKGAWFIYATAEDDDLQNRSTGRFPPGAFDPKPILAKALQNFFASMTVSDLIGNASLPVPELATPTSPPSPPPQAGTADASPEELVPYEGQKSEFTIALPKGWVAQDQSQTLGKGNSMFNLVLFHPVFPKLAGQDAKSVGLMAMKQLTGIDSGEIPSFFVQRVPAKNGMSCAGFSEKAEKDVFKMITGDPILGKGATIQEAPRSEPVSVAGCKGIRVRGTGQPARENTPQTLDAYAVSDGKVLYLFTLRNQVDYYKKNVEVFQKSMATAKLTGAK